VVVNPQATARLTNPVAASYKAGLNTAIVKKGVITLKGLALIGPLNRKALAIEVF
jgi:hypothetical protein